MILTAAVSKQFQHRFNFDSTCFNTVEGGGGGEANGFYIDSTCFNTVEGGRGEEANGFNNYSTSIQRVSTRLKAGEGAGEANSFNIDSTSIQRVSTRLKGEGWGSKRLLHRFNVFQHG